VTIYTFSEASRNFASVLEKAKAEGSVLIKRKDGSVFAVHPVPAKESPLDVQGIDLDISAEEICEVVRETRERNSH
jgi:hypothetical protein